MIICKTPYRVSFFGGGSDYPEWYRRYGGEVISCTINKYIYLSCRELPPFFNHKYRIVYSSIENCKKIKEIKHPAAREIIKKYNINNSGLEIHYDGDLPSRSGVGSSSSFVVGLINILNEFNNKKISKKQLAIKSIELEQKILAETVGSQDQIAASYGGLNNIKFLKNNKFKVNHIKLDKDSKNKFSNNLVMIYSGEQRTAKYIARSYVNKLTSEKKKYMNEILSHVKIARKLLENKDFDTFGKLLNENWMRKKELSGNISTNRIEQIYAESMNSGAFGGKLLGAGGGGFLLIYIKKNKLENLRRKLRGTIFIPLRISDEGSKIIFNQKN